MITSMIILFAIGYIGIAAEHVLNINKATFSLIMCGILWSIYATCGNDPDLSQNILVSLGDTCEIVIFLIGAMTVVELIDRYGGFNIIVHSIRANNKRRLMWVLAAVAFFLSAILDNMTTTIIMVMMLRRMLSVQKERWIFASVIVIAANSGGAWSPIGDITTIMLWMKNYVSSIDLIQNLLIPSLVSVVVPTWIATRFVKSEPVESLNESDSRVGYVLSEHHHGISVLILICGVAALLSVPVFKAITHLPPYMGILLSLGFLWLVTELIVRHYDLDGKMEGRISQVVKNIDMSTILFFLGILMAVSALSHSGILSSLAGWLNEYFHEVYIINIIIGMLSSIVDNVPLVAACMNMYPVMTEVVAETTADPAYAMLFVEDGLFWHLLTFCAGVGGSMLIIGSAAGVVAMGIEKIPFMWYLKRITLMAMSGYIAGIAVIALVELLKHC